MAVAHKLGTLKGDKHEMSAQTYYLYSLLCKQ